MPKTGGQKRNSRIDLAAHNTRAKSKAGRQEGGEGIRGPRPGPGGHIVCLIGGSYLPFKTKLNADRLKKRRRRLFEQKRSKKVESYDISLHLGN